MYKKNSWILVLLLAQGLRAQDPASLVNPFIGTANSGNTHPGAVRPWGMVSISPFNTYDTLTGSAASSPYYHGQPYLYGFTHLNMSGLGCADMGTICLMPVTGELVVQEQHRSAYSEEKASPGYYAVTLDRYRVRAALSATDRSAISCYTFPAGKSHILLNMGLGLTAKKGAGIKKVSDTEIEGYKIIGDICGLKTTQTVYFVLRVSKTPSAWGAWSGLHKLTGAQTELTGDSISTFFSFDTRAGEKIYVKTGISYTSIGNARKNLDAEQPHFDFERTCRNARTAWSQALSRIRVEGGTGGDRVKFYTAIYHTLMHPNLFNDVNGAYRIFERNRTGITQDIDRYTVFSLWDTYRSLHPFLALVYPKKASAMVKSLLGMARESGSLPRWEYAGIESGAMSGDPCLPVIADTWLRGIRDIDIRSAYLAMRHNALTPEKNNYMRPGMTNWLTLGFIPQDAPNVLRPFGGPSGPENDYAHMRERRVVWGPVSTGLEYCIADWNLAQIARRLGKKQDYQLFYNRSLHYKKSFDTAVGFMRARTMDGQWQSPFNPADPKTNAFTEGSSWNYSFMVPHDIAGLMKLMGGSKRFAEKLDSCFSQHYFDITNEPDMAYPYLFNYVKGQEYKTQTTVNGIVSHAFTDSPGGLPGNDDCGTLSAWLVFSMMGLYPDCPGNMNYQLTSPAFTKITILLDRAYYRGKKFIITTAPAVGNNGLIQSMQLNGRPYTKWSINHHLVSAGGILRFQLKTKP